MNRSLRRQIEWHFRNYEADKYLYEEKVRDIIESGLTVNFNHVGGYSQPTSSTENKAIRIDELCAGRDWAAVVRNTYSAFRFEPEYEIMVALYIEKKQYKDLLRGKKNKYGLNERTFWYWRDRWLERAFMWAKEFRLL